MGLRIHQDGEVAHLSRLAHVVAPSDELVVFASEMRATPPHSIVPSFIPDPNPEHMSAERHGWVFIGALEDFKGIDELVEAWQGRWGALTVIGGGSLEAKLRE